MPSLFHRLMKCERATTVLEYMLIAALLGLAALQVVRLTTPPLPIG